MTIRGWSVLGLLLIVSLVLSSVAPVLAQDRTVHGIDPADMDLSVDPRQDFYRFANGGWLDRTEIPADQSSYGVFAELSDQVEQDLLALLRGLEASDDLEEGSDQWKAVQMFAQGMDIETRNAQGIEPIQPFLDEIAAIDDLETFHQYLLGSTFQYMSAIVGIGVGPDFNDATMNAAFLGGPYLGLPNRDYYLEDDPSYEPVRQAYIETTAELFGYLGYDEEEAAAAAQAVYDFEAELAAVTLTREERQNITLANNPMTIDEVAALYPLMDWPLYLETLGIEGTDTLIVTEVNYLEALPEIIENTPIEVLRDYLRGEMIWSFAGRLSDDIFQTVFRYNQVLSGVDEPRPLEERVLALVNSNFPDAVGQLYVAEHFPPEAKEQIEALVDELIISFGDRLERLDWMSEETKVEAREKLANMGVKVGYPDVWQTYEEAEVEDAYVLTSLSAINAMLRENFAEAGKPVDKTEWNTPVQTVNAFYSGSLNEIIFPAGILQPPFFDYQADPASNYGAIGFVIGHEITHGFDLQGSQRDANGNVHNWWTDEDRERFMALNDEVVAQYDRIEVLPDLFINGQLTVTENVADLGGIQVAYEALGNYLESQGESLDSVLLGPAETIAGATPLPAASPAIDAVDVLASPVAGATPVATPEFTQQQRFYIAAATVWRNKTREEALVTQILTGVHSPGEVRGTQPSRNTDAFFESFEIEEGDEMYLPPEERVVIW